MLYRKALEELLSQDRRIARGSLEDLAELPWIRSTFGARAVHPQIHVLAISAQPISPSFSFIQMQPVLSLPKTVVPWGSLYHILLQMRIFILYQKRKKENKKKVKETVVALAPRTPIAEVASRQSHPLPSSIGYHSLKDVAFF